MPCFRNIDIQHQSSLIFGHFLCIKCMYKTSVILDTLCNAHTEIIPPFLKYICLPKENPTNFNVSLRKVFKNTELRNLLHHRSYNLCIWKQESERNELHICIHIFSQILLHKIHNLWMFYVATEDRIEEVIWRQIILQYEFAHETILSFA